MKIRVAGAALALLLVPALGRAQTISTESQATRVLNLSVNRTTGVSFAQTFRTPNASDVFLHSMRFGLATSGGTQSYTARLMEWSPAGSRPTGEVLFSAVGTSSLYGGTSAPYLSFDLGGLQLDATKTYAFFVSLAGGAGAASASTNLTPADAYGGGDIYYATQSGLDALKGAAWYNYRGSTSRYDFGFTAAFEPAAPTDPSVAPEPVSMALLGTGLVGIAAVHRRRRASARKG